MSFGDSLKWSEKYNNIPYRSTIFHKGPLLAMSSDITDLLSSDPKTSTKINTYKISLKRLLIDKQSSGDDDTWPNFMLYTIPELRFSKRNQNRL